MRKSPRLPVSPSPRPQKGVTLTEVMMALMVMGIGLVSVITLFPISLLRSVEATKLTNSTYLRQNAETRILASVSYPPDPAYPGPAIEQAILHDPDHDGNVFENSMGVIFQDDEHQGENFVFDPLGAWMMADLGYPIPGQANPQIHNFDIPAATSGYGWNRFGNDPQGFLAAGSLPRRYTFGMGVTATTIQEGIEESEQFVNLPDAFNTIFDGVAGAEAGMFTAPAAGDTAIAFPGTSGVLGEYVATPAQEVRVTLLNSGTRSSVVLDGVIFDASTINLADPVPAYVGAVDRLIVDIPELRYTWIATVSNLGSMPSVSIATFFRRSFAMEDEQVYRISEPPGSYNVFTMDRAANNITSDGTGGWTGLPPGFERGGWMFDLRSFRWRKIEEIQDTGGGFRFATNYSEYDDDPSPPVTYAIFPRNVIEVYTLEQKD